MKKYCYVYCGDTLIVGKGELQPRFLFEEQALNSANRTNDPRKIVAKPVQNRGRGGDVIPFFKAIGRVLISSYIPQSERKESP